MKARLAAMEAEAAKLREVHFCPAPLQKRLVVTACFSLASACRDKAYQTHFSALSQSIGCDPMQE